MVFPILDSIAIAIMHAPGHFGAWPEKGVDDREDLPNKLSPTGFKHGDSRNRTIPGARYCHYL